MSLVGNPQKVGIDAVRAFVASLDSSEKLSQSLEDVRIISQQEQQQQETAGKMRYDIDCVFKAQKI
ncbi:MAG: hypothetical protein A2178_01265 [Planctomycetes bacterium GWC2_49_10]|nr:MAG: hypothetical protein A2178_01265 [Planctomycetes bacterium GWC2_49_10]